MKKKGFFFFSRKYLVHFLLTSISRERNGQKLISETKQNKGRWRGTGTSEPTYHETFN